MKYTEKNFTTIMFLITLFIIKTSTINAFDFSPITKLNLFGIEKRQDTKNEPLFETCVFYELKKNLIIKNYVQLVNKEVIKILKKYPKLDRSNITFQEFFKIFRNGKYGQIAIELAQSENYVRSYYTFFLKNKKMDKFQFAQFMGLYILEGELLAREIHPTLSKFFPNEHQISKGYRCKVTMYYWEYVITLLRKYYIKFKWATEREIVKRDLFRLYIETHSGKCQIMAGKDCLFFNTLTSSYFGFFNMTNGKKNMNYKMTSLAFATFVFNDISYETCKTEKFDCKVIEKKFNDMKL